MSVPLDLAIVVNTVQKNKDLWRMFFAQLAKHGGVEYPVRVFVDPPTVSDELLVSKGGVVQSVHYYDPTQKYRSQFISCIRQVQEEYCIYISEDYILYDAPRWDLIREYQDVLKGNPRLSFIRFNKGGVVDVNYPKFKNRDDLYEMSNVFPYFYSNGAAIWKTRDLERIHVHGPDLHIAGNNMDEMFEPAATKTCRELGIQGLVCYHGEPKRGKYHHDTSVFPYIATALVKGRWNVSEYREELEPLLVEYNIDEHHRGTR